MSDSEKPGIVVFGSGGHAKVVIDALQQEGKRNILAIVDPLQAGIELHGYKIQADANHLAKGAFVVAIGDNSRRRDIFNKLCQDGWSPTAVSHPGSILAPDVQVGAGSVILAGAIINTATIIRENCIINTGATVDHDCRIGAHSHIAPGCNLAGKVQIGEGAFLGIGTKVIPGIQIGSWSQTGAGSAVIENVGNDIVVVGVPAKRMLSKSNFN